MAWSFAGAAGAGIKDGGYPPDAASVTRYGLTPDFIRPTLQRTWLAAVESEECLSL